MRECLNLYEDLAEKKNQFILRFCSYFLRIKKAIPSVAVRPLAVSASPFLRFYTGFVRPAPKPGAKNKRRKYDFGTDMVSR
jgi:hypothetical protein